MGVVITLMPIIIFLRGIIKGIRFMGGNVTDAVVKYVGPENVEGQTGKFQEASKKSTASS